MTSSFGAAAARVASDAIRERVPLQPRVGIILGSGLGGIASVIESPTRVPYRDVPGFPSATVVGHAGELIGGTLAGTPVVALSGRFHMYEGHDAALAGFPVRVLRALGVHTLIVSNAAGAVRATLSTLGACAKAPEAMNNKLAHRAMIQRFMATPLFIPGGTQPDARGH